MNETLLIALVGVGGASGAAALRQSWLSKGKATVPWKAVGWAVIALSLGVACAQLGVMRGLFIALTIISVGALLVVATGLHIRSPKKSKTRKRDSDSSLAPEPIERPSTWWRTSLRWLLALPIGMIAAMGMGIFYSAWTGGEPQTRLVVGGLFVPIIWGACMAWTLSDNRILRALAFLVAVIAFGFGLSVLKGFS